MPYVFKKNLANSKNYGVARNTNQIKFIVIHYTANDGDHDESNGNYFCNNTTGTSAHYFVDSDSVTQSVPDNYVAYSVGGNYGGGRLYNICTNNNSISIELCDDIKNGVIYPSQATINNALELTRTLMNKYNIPLSNVIRHYDVNGKKCPSYWVDDSKWKSEFYNKIVLNQWIQDNVGWWYKHSDGSYTKNGWEKIDGYWYYFDDRGYMKVGWIDCENGKWCYCRPSNDGHPTGSSIVSDWLLYNGKYYYLDKDGYMATYCYVKSTSKNIYYWLNKDGIYEPQWDTTTPDLKKYKLTV